jgi:hypothetical protein
MGKQVKRVPINFDWPMNKTWWGYELPEVICQTCAGMGRLFQLLTVDLIQKGEIQRIHDPERCPTCDGKGRIRPIIEIPRGTGYQLWDTTHNWSPVSPVLGFRRNWHPGLPKKEFLPLQFSHCPTSNGWILFSRKMKRSPVSSKVIWISIWTAWTFLL